ncbi:conserved hypothetical protein [Symbiobacterium thermophilum IAM 14863]|uniref:DUF1385 domain-containing protein n=1 Tax=Symbiobacterium thermophilum (strain DSM 24528 / JCM 14929 / IAM 14863 / T) TaxID=292459 RepID=Q67TD6_SYMTH|nr:conserved hypothetical protein [Symbiobacterium thermophilum IAM 14863]
MSERGGAGVSVQRGVFGGQAVIEGVMMRGPQWMAIAVRRPDGEIAVHREEVRSLMQRYPVLRLPILRGMVAMVEALTLGISALMFSANQSMPEDEQLSRGEMTVTTVVGFAFAIALFVVAPTLLTNYVKALSVTPMVTHVVEGALRLGLFIGYLVAISLMKDIQRVFQYHGAEHKVINAYEAGDELTVENVRRHSREHKRCGTSFLLYVVVISILIFSLINVESVWLRVVARIGMLPLVAGVAYEWIRIAGRHDNALVNALSRPGMWLQGLTTREPDDSQIEVAIASFETARGHGLPG